MPFRTRTDLLALAGRYATERRVPAGTIAKEILHYEILYALLQSGAAAALTFQGGTALRLCYQGTRYSEDLDFVAGSAFDPAVMAPFEALLRREIADAYGLEVEIRTPAREPAPADVHVARWSARVQMPQADRSAPQGQVIHIEVANVPAHDPDLVAVSANYPHLPEPLRQMIVTAETPREILADKMVALGARPYIKARDIWDIKFLTDRQLVPDVGLIGRKLIDYGWTVPSYKDRLRERLALLPQAETAKAFHAEMTRFVDAGVASQIANPALAAQFLRRAEALAQTLLNADLAGG